MPSLPLTECDEPMGRRSRTAGARWRVLVHRRGDDAHSWDISSGHHRPRLSPHVTSTVLDGTEFDELVAGKFLHVEQLGTGTWRLNAGGVVIEIKADRDGRPKRIDVYGPGDNADAVEGCEYEVTWTGQA